MEDFIKELQQEIKRLQVKLTNYWISKIIWYIGLDKWFEYVVDSQWYYSLIASRSERSTRRFEKILKHLSFMHKLKSSSQAINGYKNEEQQWNSNSKIIGALKRNQEVTLWEGIVRFCWFPKERSDHTHPVIGSSNWESFVGHG